MQCQKEWRYHSTRITMEVGYYSLPLPCFFLENTPPLLLLRVRWSGGSNNGGSSTRWRQQWREVSSVISAGWWSELGEARLGWGGSSGSGRSSVRSGWGGRSGLHHRREKKSTGEEGARPHPQPCPPLLSFAVGRKRRSSAHSFAASGRGRRHHRPRHVAPPCWEATRRTAMAGSPMSSFMVGRKGRSSARSSVALGRGGRRRP
jgi:hypothetical protein